MKKFALLIAVLIVFPFAGCSPSFNLFKDSSDPLKEHILSGKGADKVLMVTVAGVISDTPSNDLLSSRPSLVQEVVSQLRMAEEDDTVKAVVIKVDSPGGTATASDILFHEINEFKEKTGKKILCVFMNVAASGGYYMSLPADRIVAHPTSITGSVGVIMVQPALKDVMEKIGIGMRVNKSGRNKDIGSPFRDPTEEEVTILSSVISDLADQFVQHVQDHRKLTPEALEEVRTARIFVASRALELGLIDEIAYLPQAIEKAKEMAGIDKDSKVVVYRRSKIANDTVYNIAEARSNAKGALVNVNLPMGYSNLPVGFYYLWAPGMQQ
ncbi:MAG: signal peptide peptidase SppA [Desulfatibacillum sp.]|nr:signal peptide peptidase SppA [Desulfatibacillum sp.]